MVELYNAQYSMEMGCGYDVWRLGGQISGHPFIEEMKFGYISCPVSFDESTDELVTKSGRQYKIISYRDRNKTIEQIKKDIANGGYEAH